jgi:uncharacterized small protein (DUF1192 family)
MNYSQHPLSAAFPAMDSETFRALVEDVRSHGQRDTATLCGGMVIDGWHRYKACQELSIPCRFEEFSGLDAVAFVRSKNQHRRHYQKSQQAAIEVSLTAWAEAHRPRKGEAASPFSTNKEMANRAGTTERTIQHAKRAHEAGLGEAVRDGKVSAERAAELAKQVAHGVVTLPAAVAKVEGKTPKESKPKPKLLSEEESSMILAENARLQDVADTLAKDAQASLDDNMSMAKIFESDDRLAAAMNEIDRLRAEVVNLRSQIVGLTNGKNEAIRTAKGYKAKCERLEKQILATGRQIAA